MKFDLNTIAAVTKVKKTKMQQQNINAACLFANCNSTKSKIYAGHTTVAQRPAVFK